MSSTPRVSQPPLEEIAELTRQFASFSYSAGGLGYVLGGVLALVAYVANGLAPLTPASRLVLASFPFVWIIAKERLRRRLYQKFGRVTEPVPRDKWRVHLLCTLFVLGLSAAITVSVVGRVAADPSPERVQRAIGYLAVVIAMPALAWFFLRTAGEFIIGTWLLCQAAVVLGGKHYPFTAYYTLVFPVAAILMIAAGTYQHRQFLRLQHSAIARRICMTGTVKTRATAKDKVRPLMQLDRLVHEPARLVILTVLASSESAEFKFLESVTGLTKGNLSSHTSKLEQAGYIKVSKGFRGKKTATTFQIAARGRGALETYRRAISAMAAGKL